ALEWTRTLQLQSGDPQVFEDTSLARDRSDPTDRPSMLMAPSSQDMRPYAYWLGTGMSRAQIAALPQAQRAARTVLGKEDFLKVIVQAEQYLDLDKQQVAAAPTDWVKLSGLLHGSREGFSRDVATALGAKTTVRTNLGVQVESLYRRVTQEWLAAKVVESTGGNDATDAAGLRYWLDQALGGGHVLNQIVAPDFIPAGAGGPMAPQVAAPAVGLTASILVWILNGDPINGWPGGAPPHAALPPGRPPADSMVILSDPNNDLSERDICLLSASLAASRPLAGRSAQGANALPQARNLQTCDNLRPVVPYLVIVYRRIPNNLVPLQQCPEAHEWIRLMSVLLPKVGQTDQAVRGILQALGDSIGFKPDAPLRENVAGGGMAVPALVAAPAARFAETNCTAAGHWESRGWVNIDMTAFVWGPILCWDCGEIDDDVLAMFRLDHARLFSFLAADLYDVAFKFQVGSRWSITSGSIGGAPLVVDRRWNVLANFRAATDRTSCAEGTVYGELLGRKPLELDYYALPDDVTVENACTKANAVVDRPLHLGDTHASSSDTQYEYRLYEGGPDPSLVEKVFAFFALMMGSRAAVALGQRIMLLRAAAFSLIGGDVDYGFDVVYEMVPDDNGFAKPSSLPVTSGVGVDGLHYS
ncbi:unnamed protein product, partial [Prorocentrum cordatum]